MDSINSIRQDTTNSQEFFSLRDKEKASSLLQAIGFKMPITWNKTGFLGSITYKNRSVNTKGEDFANVKKNSGVFYSNRKGKKRSQYSI